MPDIELAAQAITAAEKELQNIKSALYAITPLCFDDIVGQNSRVKSRSPNELGKLPDYTSPDWPEAIPPERIVSTEESMFTRAEQVATMVCEKCVLGPRILDFGCGFGHIAIEMAKRTSVVAYDIAESHYWDKFDTAVSFTTNRNVVESMGPYKTIIAYDVLDHLQPSEVIDVLKWLRSLLTNDGVIFLKTHPWTSPHGCHLYEMMESNKAFLHLAMTVDELLGMGLFPQNELKITRPIAAYETLFKVLNLEVLSRDIKSSPVPDYFAGDLLKRIINVTWGGNIDEDQAKRIMATEWITYILGIA